MPSRIGDDGFGSSDLAAIRQAEFRAAERQSADTFDAYWAGSASASVMRDYVAAGLLINSPISARPPRMPRPPLRKPPRPKPRPRR